MGTGSKIAEAAPAPACRASIILVISLVRAMILGSWLAAAIMAAGNAEAWWARAPMMARVVTDFIVAIGVKVMVVWWYVKTDLRYARWASHSIPFMSFVDYIVTLLFPLPRSHHTHG
jgi:hypothetical protein